MKIADSKTTAVSLVQDALDRAAKFADYNIFTSICAEEALAKADLIDQKIAAGEPVGRLAGVPYALKDNFLSPVCFTTASSQMLAQFKSPVTATAVAKLEAEGAIMIGRTNLDSFAHGSSTENSYFGPTKNACDPTRVAGGSSGGSAAAVALGIVPFATGTDTGGSIRQPAAFNGVYGFKPTYGAISRYGVIAMASSTDCVGFFTQTAADLDLLMTITAGQDSKDATTLPDFYSSAKSSDGLTIGLIKDFATADLDPAVSQALTAEAERLQSAGHRIIELELPILKYALAVYYIIAPAELASNLSRHDGIRYGLSVSGATDLASLYSKTRSLGFMPENKRRIMIGNFVLSSGFYDAYYLKAQKARTLIINQYQEAFAQCDFLLTPVSPNPAFKLGAKVDDPVAMYLEDIMSVPVNLAGLPSLAFPVATTTDGLPIGLQLVGPRRSDSQLIDFVSRHLTVKEQY